jgi:inosine-uridine nucleoside N-ribohydrolase
MGGIAGSGINSGINKDRRGDVVSFGGLCQVPMHGRPAVGAVIDRGVIRTREMRVDVETRGEFTRGATVAARGVPRFEERDDQT